MPIYGAVPQRMAEKYGGMVRPVPSFVSVQLTLTEILKANMDRVAVVFCNFGANDIVLSLTTNVSTTRGIPVGAGGGIVGFNELEDAILPAWEWFGITSVGVTELFVLEVIREVEHKKG